MDADIIAATTSLDLEKIKAQDYRDNLASQKQGRIQTQAMLDMFVLWAKNEYTAIPTTQPVDMDRIRRQVTASLAEKYMTPNASITLPASMVADAQGDAARLKAAVDAVMALM